MSAARSRAGQVRAGGDWRTARWVNAWAPLGMVLLLYVYFAFIARAPFFADLANLQNLMIQVAPLIIATCGQILVMTVGGLDISIGGIAAFSSMAAAYGAISTGSAWGVLLGLAVGAALGAVNGWVVARYRISPVIVTIAMLSSARGLAFLVTDGQPLVGIPFSVFWLGWGDLWGIPAPVLLGLAAFLLTEYLLGYTDVGVHLQAVGSDEQGARMMGVNVFGLKVLAFALSGLAGAMAALVWMAQSGGGNQLIGSGLELQTIAAAVIGGASSRLNRSALGGVWGALVITTLSNGMNLSGVQPYTQQIVLGIFLILSLLIYRFQDRLQLVLRRGAGGPSRALPAPGTPEGGGERGR
ncbi:MAG TPA: ABC transporter permease [Limnochordales bacterium]|nr:ABC transporter permease [Limnochordales bacterium]